MSNSSSVLFKELQIRNFMSFGNQQTSVDLSNTGSTLIMGENLDANTNNGSGKCVSGKTLITIRNKHTKEITTLSIEDFYKLTKNK